MRFSAIALFFGAALAATGELTAYSTEYITVTSCAPEVTNCPARTHTKVYPIVTKGYSNATTGYYPTGTGAPAACPTYSVKTISTSVTTVIPTVIYETVSIPCPTTTGTGSYVAPTSPVTAGAGNVAFSGALAAAAGLVAIVLA